MKRLIVALLLFSAQVFAQSCPTAGFIRLADTLYNSVDGTKYNGNLAVKMTYNSTAAGSTIRGTTQNIQIKNGVLNQCMAPGWFTVTQTTNNSTITVYWVLPTSGGPYTLPQIPTGVVNVASDGITVTYVSGINFASVAVNDTVTINGVTGLVRTVTSATQIILQGSLGGSLSGVSFNDGPIERQSFPQPFPGTISGPAGPPGATTNGSLGQIMTSDGAGGFSTPYTPQGTDSKLLTSGTISGTAATLCTDAQGGATTVGCTSGGTPGGSNGQFQFNSSSTFGGAPLSINNPTNDLLTFPGSINIANTSTQGFSRFGPTPSITTAAAWVLTNVTAATGNVPGRRAFEVVTDYSGTTSNSTGIGGILSVINTTTGASGNLTGIGSGGEQPISGQFIGRGSGSVAAAGMVTGSFQSTNVASRIGTVVDFWSQGIGLQASQPIHSFSHFRTIADSSVAPSLGTYAGPRVGFREEPWNAAAVTTATGSASSNTITVASATGIAVGQIARAIGILGDTTVTNVSGTTITLSDTNTDALSGASIRFYTDNCASLAAGSTWSICTNTQSYFGGPLTFANYSAGISRIATGGLVSSAELSSDATTSGSNAVTVKGINGTLLSGLATGLLKNTTTTGVPSIAMAGTDYAVATNGTIGQALTSNGLGGFSTALPVSQSGAASSLVETDASGYNNAATGFQTGNWQWANITGSNNSASLQPLGTNLAFTARIFPSGNATFASLRVQNSSDTTLTNTGSFGFSINATTVLMQSSAAGSGTQVTVQNFGEGSAANSLTAINFQFNGVTKQTITPTMFTTPGLTVNTLSTGIGHLSSGGVLSSSAVNLASADVTGLLPNANLASSSLTFNGQTVSLGATGNVNSGTTAHTLALNQGNGAALTGAAAGTVNQLLKSGGAGVDPLWGDGRDVKIIPFGAAPAGAPGSGVSYASGQWTPTARAGTNNIGASLQAIPATGAVLQWLMVLPLDWDTAQQPFGRANFGSGTNTSGTVIWTFATACSKGDGSVTDDPAFVTESALATQTMAVASRNWWSTNAAPGTQFTHVTSGNNCVPGGSIIIRLTLSGTAAAAINAYQASITIPTLPIATQAN